MKNDYKAQKTDWPMMILVGAATAIMVALMAKEFLRWTN